MTTKLLTFITTQFENDKEEMVKDYLKFTNNEEYFLYHYTLGKPIVVVPSKKMVYSLTGFFYTIINKDTEYLKKVVIEKMLPEIED